MNVYRRDEVFPEWEPIPWGVNGAVADEQEAGFHVRALKPIRWTAIPFSDFPDGGLFDKNRDWFMKLDASHYAEWDDESLILIDNTWHGFPDPPRWGLASKSQNDDWQAWGHFPDLPDTWIFSESTNAPNQ